MERRLSAASRRSAPSSIQQLSHLAQRVGAVNLAEGFPDFPAPPHVKAAAAAAIAADHNQYRSVSPSHPAPPHPPPPLSLPSNRSWVTMPPPD